MTPCKGCGRSIKHFLILHYVTSLMSVYTHAEPSRSSHSWGGPSVHMLKLPEASIYHIMNTQCPTLHSTHTHTHTYIQRTHTPTHTHLQSLHELPCAGFGNGSEVVDQVCLGHTDTRVDDGERVVVLVGNNGDLHLFLRLQYGRVSQTLVPDLIQGLQGSTHMYHI